MKRILNDMRNLNKPGIYVLESPGGCAKLYTASNILSSLSRNINILKGDEILTVLEEGPLDELERSVRGSYYKGLLESQGKTVLGSIRKWELVSDVLPCNKNADGDYRWVVRLRNTYTELVVGVFSNKPDMEQFKRDCYSPIKDIIYCSNPETEEYYAKKIS